MVVNLLEGLDPFRIVGDKVIEYLKRETGENDVTAAHCQPNSKGLFLSLKGNQDYRYFLSPLDGGDPSKPTLSAHDLAPFCFDNEADIPEEKWLYEGLIAAGDLVVWLGREKHRKSNLILQLALSAASGRNFLGFKFGAGAALKVVLVDFESKHGSLKQRRAGIETAMGLSAADRQTVDSNLTIIEVRKIRKSGRQFPKFPHKPNPAEAKFWEEFVELYPADIYVIDPLRSLHAADENDSIIESMLAEMQRVFKGAAVIAAHHMRKPSENACSLAQDMRAFSDGARGSSAIKAHSDVIISQERISDEGNEIVHLGAFLKDGADVEPISLMESDHESFYWEIVTSVPQQLRESCNALHNAGGRFSDKAEAVKQITNSTKASRATAYRQINAMLRLGLLLLSESGALHLAQGG